MDLGAYIQIENLGKLAKVNNINVPRLRGYRLMANETPISFDNLFRGVDGECCKDLCESNWGNWDCYEFSDYTEYVISYLTRKINGGGCEPRWDRIHGWKRRKLKWEIKKQKKRIRKQYETFNKYCGRADVLYIHARIGGSNWSYYNGQELTKQHWFLEKVDDSYDSTYCDIYAKLDIIEVPEDLLEKEE